MNVSCCHVVVWHIRLGLFGHGTMPIHWLIAVDACAMHIAYKIWRNTIYSAHVVDASIERRRNTSYAIHFYKLYNVSEKWNYGVARRVESYETPSFYFIFKRILLTKVNQPMRCGTFGFYLLIFVEFVQQMVPTELADLWLSRWNLFYRLLFFFSHL